VIAGFALFAYLIRTVFLAGRGGCEKNQDTLGGTRYWIILVSIHCLVLACWYGTYSLANWFYGRYLIPLGALSLVLTSAGLILMNIPIFIKRAFITILLFIGLGSLYTFHTMKFRAGNEFYSVGLPMIRDHVPDESIPVGAYQSGTYAYFRSNVVNLDGKTNPDLNREQITVSEYLDRAGIDWLIDWSYTLESFDDEIWEMIDQRGLFELRHRMKALPP
jgi:hypothetical protein